MNTDIFGIEQDGKIDSNDFSEDAMENEPLEINIFPECGSYYNSSSSETDCVDSNHAFDSYQEQNEEKLDTKNNNNLSTSKCVAVQIKNEDDIDIFHEDIKRETSEKKSTQDFSFCKVCYQNFDIETDIFKSTSDRFECSCQKQCLSIFYNICGEDMTHDVKRTSLGLGTVSVLKLTEVGNETVSEDEVAREQDSSVVPQRLSVPPLENSDKIKRKFYSKPLENNLSLTHQMKDVTSRNDLKIHERIKTGKEPFHCIICSKVFSTSGKLIVHGRIHSGEKPFQCKICSKSFNHSGNLKVHENSHTGEKPFHCRICSKNFNQKSNLKVHEKIHTGEKPYHCKICSKSFNQKINLTVHERRLHW